MSILMNPLHLESDVSIIAAILAATVLSTMILKSVAKRHQRNSWIKKIEYHPVRSAYQGFVTLSSNNR